MSVGQKLRAKREELNITQKELAEGLCTQAMISKIERDILNPSSSTLLKIAEKLNVPVTYFYGEETVSPQLHELENIIRRQLNKTEYGDINYLITTNRDLIERCVDNYFITFFNWIEGVLKHYIHQDSSSALKILKKALNYNSTSRELKIDILTTLGTISYENAEFEEAESFFKLALHEIDETISYKKRVKILYNYSLTLESLNEYKKSLETILEAIDVLLINQSLYMLGYLYFHKAFLLRNLKEISAAEEAYENAIFVFRILNYDKMLTMAKIELKELLENEKFQ